MIHMVLQNPHDPTCVFIACICIYIYINTYVAKVFKILCNITEVDGVVTLVTGVLVQKYKLPNQPNEPLVTGLHKQTYMINLLLFFCCS